MSTETLAERVRDYPDILQGGMGVAISHWGLAGEVAAEEAVGVVSGTAIGVVLARRLQNGDMDKHMQQALAEFPDQRIVSDIVDRYYLPEGRPEGRPYKSVPVFNRHGSGTAAELDLLGAFTEVRRAQLHAQQVAERANKRTRAPIGINLLTKLELPTPSTLYGAMLAGVDCVVMGAGIPADIPEALNNLAEGKPAVTQFSVTGAEPLQYRAGFDPADYPELRDTPMTRPAFLAIVASNSLAKYLTRDKRSSPDGFVIEGPTAGGHNAPPRGKGELDERNQPVYGPRDEVNLTEFAKLDRPFWCAGGYGTPEGLIRAKENGARGVQVGSLLAVSEDSGMVPWARRELIRLALNEGIDVLTSSDASPTSYPFKVAGVKNTLSEEEVYSLRPRVCDQRLLSEAYINEAGVVSFRCPAEPIESFVKKGGDIAATVGRVCLCNALLATAGLGQIRPESAYQEPAMVTLGDGANEAIRRIIEDTNNPQFWAKDVLRWLRSSTQ